jgi:hypothetical protein
VFRRIRAVPFALLGLVAATDGHAAEGGVTHHLPGLAAELGFALPPARGWEVTNVVWSQTGSLDRELAVGGEVVRDTEIRTVLDVLVATYSTDRKIFGGTYTVGVIVPFGRSEVEGQVLGAGGATRGFSDTSTGLGDISFVPIQLNWTRGDFHFEFFQSVIAPTGNFDEDAFANVGRGYWGFDTVGAATWFRPEWGTEVSFALGLMHNAENTNSEYHTANESHLDWAINQYVTEGFAVGIRGFRLNQLKWDTGEGAIVEDLEGFEQGLGAGFVWRPAAADGQLRISGSYMQTTEVRNGRYESDYAQVSATWAF